VFELRDAQAPASEEAMFDAVTQKDADFRFSPLWYLAFALVLVGGVLMFVLSHHRYLGNLFVLSGVLVNLFGLRRSRRDLEKPVSLKLDT
jgi:hypothetical protein